MDIVGGGSSESREHDHELVRLALACDISDKFPIHRDIRVDSPSSDPSQSTKQSQLSSHVIPPSPPPINTSNSNESMFPAHFLTFTWLGGSVSHLFVLRVKFRSPVVSRLPLDPNLFPCPNPHTNYTPSYDNRPCIQRLQPSSPRNVAPNHALGSPDAPPLERPSPGVRPVRKARKNSAWCHMFRSGYQTVWSTSRVRSR